MTDNKRGPGPILVAGGILLLLVLVVPGAFMSGGSAKPELFPAPDLVYVRARNGLFIGSDESGDGRVDLLDRRGRFARSGRFAAPEGRARDPLGPLFLDRSAPLPDGIRDALTRMRALSVADRLGAATAVDRDGDGHADCLWSAADPATLLLARDGADCGAATPAAPAWRLDWACADEYLELQQRVTTWLDAQP